MHVDEIHAGWDDSWHNNHCAAALYRPLAASRSSIYEGPLSHEIQIVGLLGLHTNSNASTLGIA